MPYNDIIPDSDRPFKRRRTSHSRSPTRSPDYSSSRDELDDDQHTSPRRPSRATHRSSQPRHSSHIDASISPDELDHTYYGTIPVHRPDSPRSRSSRAQSMSSYEKISHERNSASPSPSPPRSRRPSHKPAHVNYRQKVILGGHEKGVAQVKFSPDGLWIASCGGDASIKIWSSTTGALMQTLEGHLAGVSCIAWAPDSLTLASGSDDKMIRLWDRVTGKPYPTPLKGHHNYVYSVAFSPKGNVIVSGAYDEGVFLWDVRSGRQMRNLPAHSDPVGGVDFVRDGTLVVSCANDGLIRIWDTATGQCLRTLVHDDHIAVVGVQFSPNGKYVLAWTLDSCVRLWDYNEGKCLKTYQGHVNTKYSIAGAFTICGHEAFIVSPSEDGKILIWEVQSKRIAQQLETGHNVAVLSVDTHPAGGMLVSGELDGTIRIWVNEDQEMYGNGGANGFKREDETESPEMIDRMELDEEERETARY